LAFKTSRLVTRESFLNLDNLRLKLDFMFSSLSFSFNFRDSIAMVAVTIAVIINSIVRPILILVELLVYRHVLILRD